MSSDTFGSVRRFFLGVFATFDDRDLIVPKTG